MNLDIFLVGLVSGGCLGLLLFHLPELLRRPRRRSFEYPPLRVERAYDWRRRFSHENTNRPSGPPPLKLQQTRNLREGSVIRGNGQDGPSTDKPPIDPRGRWPGGPVDPTIPYRVNERGRLQWIGTSSSDGHCLRCPPGNVIAECGGPCEQGFQHCNCGLVQVLNPHLYRQS